MSEERSIVDRYQDQLSKLTITDQLDVKWILLRQFSAISELMRAEVYNFDAVEFAILTLYNMIPKSMVDDEFVEDVGGSYDIVRIDESDLWCGIRVKPYKIREEKRVNPLKLLSAITNLFDRDGLWLRKTPKTVFRGKRYGEQGSP